MRIKDIYTSEEIKNLNCIAFIGTLAMIIVSTIAKIVGVI